SLIDPDYGAAHTADINRLVLHPCGALLASGSGDNTPKVWDLAADQLVFKLTVLTESVVFPEFSPDGQILAVGTSEGTTLYEVLGLDTMTTRCLGNDPVQDFAFLAGSLPDVPRLTTTTLERLPERAARGAVITDCDPASAAASMTIPFQTAHQQESP